MVICEYLDDVTGQEYSPQQHAACRLWASFMQSWFAYVAILKTEPGSEEEKAAVHELRHGLRAADAFLSRQPEATSGPFLLGDRFSLAEIATAPFAQRFAAVLPGMRPALEPRQILANDGLTRLSIWLDAVCSRPSCSATIPPAEELVASYTSLLERMKATG
jgi:glutathione S-transferase